jgi:hypothetical protein
MRIYKKEIPDILSDLPNLEPFDARGKYDLAICTLGFEDRTHQIVDNLILNYTSLDTRLLLVKYPTNEDDNLRNHHYFKTASEKMSSFDQIVYSRINYLQELPAKLGSISGAKVLFDISTCSSYVFYPTMRRLLEYDIDLSIAYSEAAIYHPTPDEWSPVAKRAEDEKTLYVQSFERAEFQSLGVDNIYPSSLFSEMNPGNKPTILVAVPNFSVMRMNAMITRDQEINKTPYDNIIWLLGEPPAETNKWRVDAIKRTHNLTTNNQKIFPVSTLDYKDMLKSLENIWLENRYSNSMTIACLGSKMQHVGTLLFLYLHQEVGLWMSEPKKFQAQKFSSGFGNAWQVRFGLTKDLRKRLNEYMKFSWDM